MDANKTPGQIAYEAELKGTPELSRRHTPSPVGSTHRRDPLGLGAQSDAAMDGGAALMSSEQIAELYNLFHLARTALADRPHLQQTRYHRKQWAVAEFIKKHPEVSAKRAYLTFERVNETV
jgi:hypothetical protein